MSVPEIVDSALDGEEIATRVSLGGDDELFVTSSNTLLYRADGLLSDESVDEFPHNAERLTLSEGRRKTKFSLEYPLEGTREFTIPTKKTEAVLHPVLAGVLSGNGITDPGETVVQTYRFSELTLILTSDRLVKHIGEAVWDTDFEQYHFGDVSELSFEDGSVATQIVLTVDGRPQRIKAPNEHVDDLRERLERALFSYHDVDSLDELNAAADGARTEPESDPTAAFGEGVDPLNANDPEDEAETGAASGDPLTLTDGAAAEPGTAETDPNSATPDASGPDASAAVEPADADGTGAESPSGGDPAGSGTDGSFGESGFEPATATDPELLERVADLEAQVAEQTELLERQQETIEQLIEELRAGR